MSRVLIAEDNPTNRELLREFLELMGHTVREACNGEDALKMIEQESPDVLLLDLSMPGLDGFGVVRRIREDSRIAGLPVLAVTAYAMQGDRERILESGFDGYLSKPLNFSLLSEEISRFARPIGESRGASTNA